MTKITPTSVLTSGFHVLLTIALGAFLLLTAAVVIFKVADGMDSHARVEALGPVKTGRVHIYEYQDYSRYTTGEGRQCVFVNIDGEAPRSSGNCTKVVERVDQWRSYAPEGKMGNVERFLWSLLLFVVFGTAAYLIAGIPAHMVALALPPLMGWVRLITIVMTLPILILMIIFFSSVWTFVPTYWMTSDGWPVDTQEVFIDRDNNMYTKPSTLYHWTKPDTGTKLVEKVPQ